MTYIDLTSLPVGGSGRVKALHARGAIRRRLLDMGLTCGTRTACLYQSPSGDPRAYMIRGAVVALRSEEARQVEVTPYDR